MTYGNRNPKPTTYKEDVDFGVTVEPAENLFGVELFVFDVTFAVAELEPGSAEDKIRDVAATLEDAGWPTQARQVSDAADAFACRGEATVESND